MPSARVDRELGDLRAVAVDGVGDALAVGVERRGRRVVALLGGEDVARGVDRQRGEVDGAGARRPASRAPASASGASGPALAWRRIAARSAAAGARGGVAGDERLARGRGLAGVGGQRGVGGRPA